MFHCYSSYLGHVLPLSCSFHVVHTWASSIKTVLMLIMPNTLIRQPAHGRAGFDKARIFEIHGNVTTWQCGSGCGAKTWVLPPEHRFMVGEDMRAPNMRCMPKAPEGSTLGNTEEQQHVEEAGAESVSGGAVKAIRSLHRSGSSLTCYQNDAANRHVDAAVKNAAAENGAAGVTATRGGYANHVRCTRCGRLARPNVLMFEDEDWEVLFPLTQHVCTDV
jgi:hypothetical protein